MQYIDTRTDFELVSGGRSIVYHRIVVVKIVKIMHGLGNHINMVQLHIHIMIISQYNSIFAAPTSICTFCDYSTSVGYYRHPAQCGVFFYCIRTEVEKGKFKYTITQ